MRYSDIIRMTKQAMLVKQADPAGQGIHSNYYRFTKKDPGIHLSTSGNDKYKLFTPSSEPIKPASDYRNVNSINSTAKRQGLSSSYVNNSAERFHELLNWHGWRPSQPITPGTNATVPYTLDNARTVAFRGNEAKAQEARREALDKRWQQLYADAKTLNDIHGLDAWYDNKWVPPVHYPQAYGQNEKVWVPFMPPDAATGVYNVHMDDGLAYRAFSADEGRQNYVPAGIAWNGINSRVYSPVERFGVFLEETAGHPSTQETYSAEDPGKDVYNVATGMREAADTTVEKGYPYEFSNREGSRALSLAKAYIPDHIEDKSDYFVNSILSGNINDIRPQATGYRNGSTDIKSISDKFQRMRNNIGNLKRQLSYPWNLFSRSRINEQLKTKQQEYDNAVRWLRTVAPQANNNTQSPYQQWYNQTAQNRKV